MPTPKKAVKHGRPIETLSRDPTPVLPANNSSVVITPWDFALQSGQVLEATEQKLKVQEGICVHMSPQHTKVFSRMLDKLIKVYEEKYGAIPEPEGTREALAILPG